MIQTLLVITSLLGNYFNCKKMIICFYIWIACNIGWTVVDILAGSYSRSILDIVQIGFSIFGIIQWTKLHKESKEND